jgi:hypothetical protein
VQNTCNCDIKKKKKTQKHKEKKIRAVELKERSKGVVKVWWKGNLS